MNYCSYYQAHIRREKTWLFVALLRGLEHVAFDRTLDASRNLFEFYVPKDQESCFLDFMQKMAQEDVVANLAQLPNRLTDPEQKL